MSIKVKEESLLLVALRHSHETGGYMGTSATKAKNKYNKANYERIPLIVKPKLKEELKEVANKRNESVNSFINTAILRKLEEEYNANKKDDERPKCFKFSVFYNSELTADVDVKENDVLIKRYTMHPVKQIFYADRIPRYKLGEILELRCWDKNRVDLLDCLHKIGLSEYNPYEICRRTHGITYADKIWFRYENDYFDGISKLEGLMDV